MLDNQAEIQKVIQFLDEAAKLAKVNPILVASEQFFRIWQDACSPRPFFVPPQGIFWNNSQIIGKTSHDNTRIAYLDWHQNDKQPILAIEAENRIEIQRIIVDNKEIIFGKPEDTSPDPNDMTFGDKVEAMAEVVAILKQDYPNLNLHKASNSLIREALEQLASKKPSPIINKLKSRRTGFKILLDAVLAEMVEDEISSQLTLNLEEQQPQDEDIGEIAEQPIAITIPERGKWDVKADISILLEAYRLLEKCDEDFTIPLKDAQMLVEKTDNAETIKLNLPQQQIISIKEGAKFNIAKVDSQKSFIGTFSADIIEDGTIIGRIEWDKNLSEIPPKSLLIAMPRQSSYPFIISLLDNLITGIDKDKSNENSPLKAILGIKPLPYRHHPYLKGKDPQQSNAIHSASDAFNLATLIQGPPGTGKSSVLVQLVEKVTQEVENAKIIITAPTHAAVDNICRKLLHKPLFRHGSSPDSIDHEVLKSAWTGNRKIKAQIEEKALEQKCEIHAGTHIGILKSHGISDRLSAHGPFDLIVFDEAGMSPTAEVIPCICLAKRVVIFGDIKQLPPFPFPDAVQETVQRNHALTQAQSCLLNGSLMAWLQDFRQLQPIMLTTCYRSQNPRLMKFASRLFYNAKVLTNPNAEYFKLPFKERQAKYPRETLQIIDTAKLPTEIKANQLIVNDTSPGYENITEAKIAAATVLEKINTFELNEICVISPYRRQAKLIRKLLAENKPKQFDDETWTAFTKARISTVDSFQGGESDVVIVSYVRSGLKGVGFIDDPNRANVTHTRSKREMIVIGDFDHLGQYAKNNIFQRLKDAIQREGIVNEIQVDQLAELTSSIADIESTTPPEQPAPTPPMPPQPHSKPVQLTLFDF